MSYPKKLVIATGNQGKFKEYQDMLGRLNLEILSLKDFPGIKEIKEDGETFAENALIKARLVAQLTGLVSLADDSGLEVDALGGQPGVRSARFAGIPTDDRKNNLKLLNLLKDRPLEDQRARFKCVLAIVTPRKKEYLVEGVCEGLILTKAVGSGGFGYDPLFYLPDYQKSFAQLKPEVKNRISHRGQAIQKAIGILGEIFADSRNYS